ncbi:cytochrome c biogenesis heme-transporting ATPase CcmA [Methylococcus sp. Mc7]|uniref:cytochrome c biogenesis heme-transporting ATPase CcmA n=1 Tax=Methylococcus sp. Mc7 TaxID=2860258 RepID=UPI001C52DC69|nr:cytochrome c biogenesis heme-transporting ATPase CcmA [Methylococcus sp. Mc7]QXP84367.1 cytochrome c biogenesis heme-transporting ATPase CcmA [Methylococcus sp. Mc7]
MSDAPLRAAGLECIRGDRLLFSGLNLNLSPSQLLQVEGANGAGKTSLLRVLAGLSRPADGEVRWRGLDIQHNRASYFAEMVYMGHAPGLKAELSPLENLRISTALRDEAADDARIEEALARVGLRGFEDVPARGLSAGQKQRTALCRLLLNPVPLWILDEPFTALDVRGIALVRELLEAHLANGGMVLMTSHHALEVRGDCRSLNLT